MPSLQPAYPTQRAFVVLRVPLLFNLRRDTRRTDCRRSGGQEVGWTRGRTYGFHAGNAAVYRWLVSGHAALLGPRPADWVRRLANDPDGAMVGVGTLEGAVFGLLALLVAFAFSGAAVRFETRRQLIIEETNDVGTAYLRLDLLPLPAQPPLRDRFRQYVSARLDAYRQLPDIAAATQTLARATALQAEIWTHAVGHSREPDAHPDAGKLLLPALNAMFDITTTRTAALYRHPPIIIFLLLFVVALVSALLAGHGLAASRRRNWFHMVGFAAVITVAVYVILNLEFPRLGFIQVSVFDQALSAQLESMR